MDLSLFMTVDEDGNEVEAPRPQTKSWSDVEQAKQRSPFVVVCQFIELAQLGDQWDWYASYKQWLADCEAVDEYNAARVPDEETGELPGERPLPVMPERPVAQALFDCLVPVKLAEINRWTDQQMNALVAAYPEREIQSWDQQLIEAKYYLSGGADHATPLLDGLAAARDMDKTKLANRVVEKAAAFAQASGTILGYRQKLEDAVVTASTPAELAAVELPEQVMPL